MLFYGKIHIRKAVAKKTISVNSYLSTSKTGDGTVRVVFTVPMTLVMTAVGLKMGGQPMYIYRVAFLESLPKMLIAAYISVLIFLPLSMKLSGMDKLGLPAGSEAHIGWNSVYEVFNATHVRNRTPSQYDNELKRQRR